MTFVIYTCSSTVTFDPLKKGTFKINQRGWTRFSTATAEHTHFNTQHPPLHAVNRLAAHERSRGSRFSVSVRLFGLTMVSHT